VAERYALPVYLYERAARRPERSSLALIRSGGLEGLAARLADPAWAPDFGPARLHPTGGAAVIGARFFLVAFNAVLATADVAVARAVASRVREANGGLPAVRALGIALASRGLAQVSMNLLDYRRTSPLQALRRVEAEAAALGTRVLETEIVGLVPAAAVRGVAAADLELRGELPILEERLAGAL
jgi:glutamate formiminotransferase